MRLCNQRFKNRIELRTQEQPLVAKHTGGTIRPQPHPPHRRGTFHRRLKPLYTEKHKVSCSGFLPKTYPMQHSCNHSNAIMQPEIQEPHRFTHTGTTTRYKTHRRNNSRMKRPRPHPPHRRGTFHRRLQPLYPEKHKVSCSGFLPKIYPM